MFVNKFMCINQAVHYNLRLHFSTNQSFHRVMILLLKMISLRAFLNKLREKGKSQENYMFILSSKLLDNRNRTRAKIEEIFYFRPTSMFRFKSLKTLKAIHFNLMHRAIHKVSVKSQSHCDRNICL